MLEYVVIDDICRCTYFKNLYNGMYTIFLAYDLLVDHEKSRAMLEGEGWSSVRSVLVDAAISCSTNQDHGASDPQKSPYCGQGVVWPQWKLTLSGRRQPSNHKAD